MTSPDKPQCPTCGSTDPRFMVHAGSYPTLCGNSFHDAPPSHQGDGGQAGATPCKTCDGRGFGVISDEYPLGNPRDCPNCNGTGVQTPKTPAKIDAEVSSPDGVSSDSPHGTTTSITPPTSFAAEVDRTIIKLLWNVCTEFTLEEIEDAMKDNTKLTEAKAAIMEAVEKLIGPYDTPVLDPSSDEYSFEEVENTGRNNLRDELLGYLHE